MKMTMRKMLAILATLAILCTVLPLGALFSAVADDGDNLFLNGDFETGNADGWRTWQGTEIIADAAHNGGYGAHLVGDGGWGGMLDQTISVTAGAQYKLSFWINVNAMGVNVQVKDGSGNSIEGAGGWFDANKKDKLVEWTFTAPDDTVFVNFCGSGSAPEDVYVDDFVLVALGGGDAPAQPSNDGYIINGDFETGDLAPWDNLWGSCPKAEVIEGGKDSAYALNVVSGQWCHVRQTGIVVEANTDYKITAWAKNANNMCLLVKNGADTKDIVNVGVNAGDEWTQFTAEFNSGEFTSIIFSLMGGEGADQYGIFDSIVMEKVGGGDAPIVPVEGNVIANGDFAENIDGWYASGGTAIDWQDGALHGDYNESWGFIGYNVDVKANTDYVLTFKAKSINGGVVTPKMNKTDWSGTVVEFPCEFGADWADYTWEFNSGDYTAFMLFFQSGHPDTDGQEIWLDDVVLAEKVGGGDTPIVPDVPAGDVLNATFDSGEFDGLQSSSDISVADGALQFNITADWGNVYSYIDVEANTDYTVSFRAKSKLGKSIWVKFNNNWGPDVAQADASIGTEWKEYSVTLNSGDCTSLILLMQYNGYAADGEVMWFDYIIISKSGETPVLPPEPPVSGDSLLFEDFEDALSDDWSLTTAGTSGIVDGAMKIEGNAYGEILTSPVIPLKEGVTYTVSFDIKLINKGEINFQVKNCYEDNAGKGANLILEYINDASVDSWKTYSYSFKAEGLDRYFASLLFVNHANTDFYVDNIVVTSDEQSDVPVTGNVLVNGDFEDGSNGWELGSSASIVDDAHTGIGALQLENPGMWAGAALQTVSVTPDTNYIITMWVKRVKDTKPFNLFIMNAADNRNLEVVKGQNWFNTNDTEWTEKTLVVNTGDATEMIIKWSSETNNAGIILIDDMQVYAEGQEPGGDQPNATGLVVNGDFETGDASGWETWQSTSISEDAAHSGKYGAYLVGNGSWGGLLNQTMAVENGETYTITLWVCINGKSGVNLQIKGADKVEGECDNTYLDPGELKGWTLRSFNVVANSDEITLNFCGGGTNVAEDIYIDDITMVKKGELPPGADTSPIKNAGFETGDLTGWINLYDACTYSFETPGHNKSNYALNFSAPGQWQQIRQDKIPVEPNTDYVVVGMVKNPLNVNIVVKNGDDSANVNEVVIENDLSNKWQLAKVEFNSGDLDSICVLLISREAGASAIFDDVQVYVKGTEPTEAVNDEEVTEGPIMLDKFGVAINRPVSADTNLILNGSFEEAEGGQWQSILGDTLTVVDDETAPDGNKSLYFNTTGVESSDKTLFHLDVEPETDYVFSAWVKGAFISDDNRFNATLGVVDYKNNFAVYGDYVFSTKDRQIVPTCWDNEWHLRSVQFNSGANIKVAIGFAGSLSQMWVDDIALFKVDDGIKYADPRQIDYILASGLYAEDGGCADEDNLLPDADMSGTEIQEFWASAEGYKNGFLSFVDNKYEYGTSLKYTESDSPYNTYAIKWLEVKPHTTYTFSVDMRVVKEGDGKLVLLDGKKRECFGFLMVDFDKGYYGSDWFTIAVEFNSSEFDRIGIAIVDGGGVALIDNMRLFESADRVEGGVSVDYVKPPYVFGSPNDPHYVEGITPDEPGSPDTGVSVVGAVLAMALVPSSAVVAFKLRRKKEDEE